MGVAVEGGGRRLPKRLRVDPEVGGAGGVLSVSLCASNVVPSVSMTRFRRLEINRSVCRVSSVMRSTRDLSFSQPLMGVSTEEIN